MASLPKGNEEIDEIRNSNDGTASCDAFVCGGGLLQMVHIVDFLVVLSVLRMENGVGPETSGLALFTEASQQRQRLKGSVPEYGHQEGQGGSGPTPHCFLQERQHKVDVAAKLQTLW